MPTAKSFKDIVHAIESSDIETSAKEQRAENRRNHERWLNSTPRQRADHNKKLRAEYFASLGKVDIGRDYDRALEQQAKQLSAEQGAGMGS